MKLAKISLATLVALGAFSSVASATPLEEAIKNVDLSGFARYRYDSTQEKASTGGKDTTKSSHNFRSIVAFKAALDDNFFGVLSFRYTSGDASGKASGKDNVTDTGSTFAVNELYLGYTRGNTTLTAGKQKIGSFFTDDEAGTGIKLMNKDIEGLTLAAFAFDDLENSSFTDNDAKDEFKKQSTDTTAPASPKKVPTYLTKDGKVINIFNNNLYGVAAIGSYDPVSFELWYATLVDVANIIAADIKFDFDITSDVNFAINGQYAHADIDGSLEGIQVFNEANNAYVPNSLSVRDTDFYAVEVGTGLFGADLSAGYIGWKVKDKAYGFVSLEDNGKFIDPSEQTFGYTLLQGRGNFWFVGAGYKFDKFGIGADYIKGNIKTGNNNKTKIDEAIARASYDYSAKLKFKTFFSHQTEKENNSGKDKSNKFRFEARYSF